MAKEFTSQHTFQGIYMHGEAGSVDHLLITKEKEELRQSITEYDPDNVYNMDETGLFYRLLPLLQIMY